MGPVTYRLYDLRKRPEKVEQGASIGATIRRAFEHFSCIEETGMVINSQRLINNVIAPESECVGEGYEK